MRFLFVRLTFFVLFFFFSVLSFPQIELIRSKLEAITSSKDAITGISIMSKDGVDTLSLNGDMKFPMQSVFKFHIALVVLSEVDNGNLSLNQKVEIIKSDLLPDTWSPIREKFPNGTEMSLSDIIKYTVSLSDNNGCDILLRMVGGTKKVNDFFIERGFSDLSIVYNEEEMHKDWVAQFSNYSTPKSASIILKSFIEGKILKQETTDFLMKVMIETATGINRIKGKLPQGTSVAHKTGSSGKNESGISAAVNDIGIVFLSEDEYYFFSAFITNSKETDQINEQIISDISRIVWDYFSAK